MGLKEDAYFELRAVMREKNLAPSTVGREIAKDPTFVKRFGDKKKTISVKTLDKVWKYILKQRGQMELDLEKKD